MAFCSFSGDSALYDSTPIENLFLTEYLRTAPADALRVYLCLRMWALHPSLGSSFEELPELLGLEPESVQNALTYWEREGLVKRVSDNPPTYELSTLRRVREMADPMEEQYYQYRGFNKELQLLFDTKDILHPKQYAMAADWISVFGLSQEAVLALVAEAMTSGSRKPTPVFKRLDDFIKRHADSGMKSREDVLTMWAMDAHSGSITVNVLKRLGIRRSPTLDEIALCRKWVDEWRLTEKEILAACAETVKSRSPSLAYLDRILASDRSGVNETFELAKRILAELGQQQAVPSPDQTARLDAMLKKGFDPDALRLAAVQAAGKNRRRFEDFEWYVSFLDNRGIRSYAETESFFAEQRRKTDEVRTLLEKAGVGRRPGRTDLENYERWSAVLSPEIMDYAAGLANGRPSPMAYLEKLLTDWTARGVQSLDEAKALHEAAIGARTAARTVANPALGYSQRTHTAADYEDLLYGADDEETEK